MRSLVVFLLISLWCLAVIMVPNDGCASAETIKKFELTATLGYLDRGINAPDPWLTWTMGSKFFLQSADPSIQKRLHNLEGRKVRIIVYEVD